MATARHLSEQSGISRRSVLQSTATAGVALLTAPFHGIVGSQPGDIDAHVHVWTPDTTAYPLAEGFAKSDMAPASFTPEQLMAHARPAGVARVVLIQMSYYGYDNRYMLDVIEKHPDVFKGVAIVDETSRPADTMKQLATQGVTGFRIQPKGRPVDSWLTGTGMKKMWACGADANLAMCHLINPEHLPSVATACRAFPDTPVVIDHFARIGIDGRMRKKDLDNLCRLAEYPRVSVKVSAYYALGKKQMPYRDLGPMIRRVRDAFGADRMMWASDCPFQVDGDHTYAASIELIRSGLEFLSDDERAAILHGTAARVFFHETAE